MGVFLYKKPRFAPNFGAIVTLVNFFMNYFVNYFLMFYLCR